MFFGSLALFLWAFFGLHEAREVERQEQEIDWESLILD